MANIDTALAIDDNLKSLIDSLGHDCQWITFINIENEAQAKFPLCDLRFIDEDFEFNHGQKPKFNTRIYSLRFGFKSINDRELTRLKTEAIHDVRNGFNINAMNVGDLSVSKLVNWVSIEDVAVEDDSNNLHLITMELHIKYREDVVC